MRARILVGAAFLACAQAPPPKPRATDPEAEARASAEAFLTCVERAGAECRPEEAPYEAWFAVYVLGRIRQGVPTLLLARLPEWLRAAQDPTASRRTFVQALESWDRVLHDGECRPGPLTRLFPRGAAPLAQAALDRAASLGLLRDELAGELQSLAAKAQTLDQARVLETHCPRATGPLFLVLAPDGGAFRPVALEASRPTPDLARPASARVAFQPPNDVVSPFIPVPGEAL